MFCSNKYRRRNDFSPVFTNSITYALSFATFNSVIESFLTFAIETRLSAFIGFTTDPYSEHLKFVIGNHPKTAFS